METQAKVFLVLSLIGLVLLMFISQFLPPKTLKISEINEDYLNHQVKLTGKITSIKEFSSNDLKILTIEDETGNITAILFSKEKLDILKKEIILIGKVMEYKKELQMNIEKIIKK